MVDQNPFAYFVALHPLPPSLFIQDTMYVFGGSKLPQETITNELWAFNLTNRTWTNLSEDREGEIPMNNSSNSTGTVVDMGSGPLVAMGTTNQMDYLPLAVRGHTAHVVGSKMVVLFGQAKSEQRLVAFVQEYNLGESS